MKYSVGQKVKIRSLEWYQDNVNRYGIIECGKYEFFEPMNEYCGKVVTIKRIDDDNYRIDTDKGTFCWTDEMIEGLAEDENNPLAEIVVDTVKESNDRDQIVIDSRFDVEVDEGEYYAVRRKKAYPKTYEECCSILGCKADYFFTDFSYNNHDVEISDYEDKIDDLLQNFRKLIYCRDAYWKIAGEEMGLGKPWEPDWNNISDKYCIYFVSGDVWSKECQTRQCPFAFPTPEMRDAFKENFDPDIEICKELL